MSEEQIQRIQKLTISDKVTGTVIPTTTTNPIEQKTNPIEQKTNTIEQKTNTIEQKTNALPASNTAGTGQNDNTIHPQQAYAVPPQPPNANFYYAWQQFMSQYAQQHHQGGQPTNYRFQPPTAPHNFSSLMPPSQNRIINPPVPTGMPPLDTGTSGPSDASSITSAPSGASSTQQQQQQNNNQQQQQQNNNQQ